MGRWRHLDLQERSHRSRQFHENIRTRQRGQEHHSDGQEIAFGRVGIKMTETNLFNGIEHVTIAAKDPKGLARWYCSTFGFKIAYESTRSLTTYVRLGESLLEIIEAGDADRVSHGERDSGFRHMAISVTDINKAYKNLSSRGSPLSLNHERRKACGPCSSKTRNTTYCI